MRRLIPTLLMLALAPRADACEAALVLAMDVSGSIDAAEYRLQVDGLAAALADPDVIAVILEGEVALAVTQWSGLGRQAVAVPWTRLRAAPDIARLAASVRTMPRLFAASDTAVGEALTHAIAQFAAVPDCKRRIVDMSGDGPENTGFTAAAARRAAIAAGVEVNALAVESMGLSITQFYRNWIITPRGFVVSARGHLEYARAIREKLLRELARPAV